MKKIIFSLAFIIGAAVAFAQAPEKFQYQTVVRDNTGAPIANQSVSFRLNIHESTAAGTTVYSETHTATTNDFGLVALELGGGTVVSGTFNAIDWGGDSYYVEVELDPAGGSSYTSMGTTQLLSVPYALSSKTASDMDLNDLSDVSGSPSNGQVLSWNGSNWGPTTPAGGSSLWTLNGSDVIRTSGNVGINNTSFAPLFSFTVSGDSSAAIALGAQGSFNQQHSGRLVFTEDVLYTSGTCGFEWMMNGSTNRLVMVSGCPSLNDTSLIINRSGEVLVNERLCVGGSTNPSTDLHIRQSGSSTTPGSSGIRFQEGGATTNWQQWAGGSDLNFAFNGTRVGYINDANGAYVTTSDRRVKTNILPMSNVLAGVMKLKPVTYHYKHHVEGNASHGFIAQEVLDVFPQLVYHSEGEDDQLALAYSDFGILAIKAIQEQQSEIEKIKAEKQALADKNAELEERLKKLEAAVNSLLQD